MRASIVLLGLAPSQAAASCAVAAQLATLHQAYGDLLDGDSTPRGDIGRFVIERDLGGGDLSGFLSALAQGGFAEDIDRLAPVLDDMTALTAGEGEHAQHSANRAALAETLRATGCFRTETPESEVALDTPPPADNADSLDDYAENEIPETDDGTSAIDMLSDFVSKNPSKALAIAAAALVSVGGLGYLIRRRIQKNKARALPRFPLGTSLAVTNASGTTLDVFVVDISRGGLKVAREGIADPAAFLTSKMRLGGASYSMRLMWENSHFLGLEFDTLVDEAVIAALVDSVEKPVREAAA